jgi:hypothetical protein
MEEGTPGGLVTHWMSRKEQECGGNMVNCYTIVNDEKDTEWWQFCRRTARVSDCSR